MSENIDYRNIIVFLLCFFCMGFMPVNIQLNNPAKITAAKQSEQNSNRQVMQGVIIVKFKVQPNINLQQLKTQSAKLDKLIQRYNINRIEPIFTHLEKSPLPKAKELSKIFFFHYQAKVSATRLAWLFAQDKSVEYAEPKYAYKTSAIPNDTRYAEMDQFARVNAEAAWDIVKGEEGEVVIAIIDSGTDWDHSDLIDNIWRNEDEIASNGIDDDGNGYIDDVRGWNFPQNSNDPTSQLSSHGTHVSGTAAATTNNELGVAGMSWNAQLMGINANSSTDAAAISFGYEGITYAAANGAHIINCSWGGAGIPSQFEQEIIDFAMANGALVIAAAGNDNVNNDETAHFPGSYKGVLSVGSTQPDSDSRSGFSNYGRSVDVFAPGSSILSTTPGGGYGNSSGTSMSAPMVAGLAGLVKTLHPDWSPDKVREQIRTTCDNIDADNSTAFTGLLGRGRVNALRALTEDSSPAIRIKNVVTTEQSGNGDEIIDKGETINVAVEYVNYLADAEAVDLLLTSENSNITLTNDANYIDVIKTDESITVFFQFEVSPQASEGERLLFTTDIESGDYQDFDSFELRVTPPQFIDHNTGPLQVSITNTGNIGFGGFSDSGPGSGFVYDGRNYLFEGGLMVATLPTQISDCVRGDTGSDVERDFKMPEGIALDIISPGEEHYEEAAVLLVDSLAERPINISILQESFADTTRSRQNFVIFQYQIKNENSFPLAGLFAGLFFDWDISTDFMDDAAFDAERRMGYAVDEMDAPQHIAATKVLSNNVNFAYRSIHNPDELYDNFTDSEKWSFMTSGIQTETLNDVDVSNLTTAGPFDVPPGETVNIAFALIAAHNIFEMNAAADTAQAIWDAKTATVDVKEPNPITVEHLQAQPNPFTDNLIIQYELKKPETVAIQIYNLQGKLVQQWPAKQQIAGLHQLNWNGQTIEGQDISSGSYLVRIQAGTRSISQKVVAIR